MELIESFGDLTLADSAFTEDHRVATRGEKGAVTLSIPADAALLEDFASQAELRWSEAIHEKTVLENRLKRSVTWEEMITKMDGYHQRFYKKQIVAQIRAFNSVPRAAAKQKHNRAADKHVPNWEGRSITAMCINEYFAAALVCDLDANNNPLPATGTIWSFPVALFESANVAWHNTGLQLDDYKISCLSGSRLYVVDGPTIKIFELTQRKLLAEQNLWEKSAGGYGILLTKAASSLRASMHGFIVICSVQRGFLLLHHNSHNGRIELVHYENPHLRDTEEGRKTAYTACSIHAGVVVLGTSTGLVEWWEVIEHTNADAPYRFSLDWNSTNDYFVPRNATRTNKPLEIVQGEPVRTLVLRGSELMVASQQNRVTMSAKPKQPIVVIPKSNTVASAVVLGDLLALLYVNGELQLAQFSNTQAYCGSVEGIPLVDKDTLPMGQQFVTLLPDCVMALMPGGVLLTMNQNRVARV